MLMKASAQDDGSEVISCDRCEEWQHLGCHVSADAAAGRPKVDYATIDFLCSRCRADPTRGPSRRKPPPKVDALPALAPAPGHTAGAGTAPSLTKEKRKYTKRVPKLGEDGLPLPRVKKELEVGPDGLPIQKKPRKLKGKSGAAGVVRSHSGAAKMKSWTDSLPCAGRSTSFSPARGVLLPLRCGWALIPALSVQRSRGRGRKTREHLRLFIRRCARSSSSSSSST